MSKASWSPFQSPVRCALSVSAPPSSQGPATVGALQPVPTPASPWVNPSSSLFLLPLRYARLTSVCCTLLIAAPRAHFDFHLSPHVSSTACPPHPVSHSSQKMQIGPCGSVVKTLHSLLVGLRRKDKLFPKPSAIALLAPTFLKFSFPGSLYPGCCLPHTFSHLFPLPGILCSPFHLPVLSHF